MPRGLSSSTRQERLAELREYALDLLDRDDHIWKVIADCGQYIDSTWGLNEGTKKEYLEWVRQQLKDIFVQHERRKALKSSV